MLAYIVVDPICQSACRFYLGRQKRIANSKRWGRLRWLGGSRDGYPCSGEIKACIDFVQQSWID